MQGTLARRRAITGSAALALTLVMACTSCGRSNSPPNSAAPSATLPAMVAHSPAQFIAGPCPTTPQPVPLLQRAHCGVLVVPQDRTKPEHAASVGGDRSLPDTPISVAIQPPVTIDVFS